MVFRRTRGRRAVYRRKKRVFKRTRLPLKRVVQHMISKSKETYKKTETASEVAVNSIDSIPTYAADAMSIAQGTTYLARQGHKLRGIGINTRFLLYNNGGGPMFIRFLALVNYRGTKDTDYTTGTALFENDSGNVNFSSASNLTRLHLPINREKYRVLHDRIYKLGGTNDSSRCKIVKVWTKLNRIYQYEGSSATLPEKNNIIFMWFSSEANADEVTGVATELHYTNTFYFKNM